MIDLWTRGHIQIRNVQPSASHFVNSRCHWVSLALLDQGMKTTVVISSSQKNCVIVGLVGECKIK